MYVLSPPLAVVREPAAGHSDRACVACPVGGLSRWRSSQKDLEARVVREMEPFLLREEGQLRRRLGWLVEPLKLSDRSHSLGVIQNRQMYLRWEAVIGPVVEFAAVSTLPHAAPLFEEEGHARCAGIDRGVTAPTPSPSAVHRGRSRHQR